ncbi:hypothetical protein L211DRAFT_869862 [Terfezia boudieri ATCC MYA-4762]|uniref:Cep57 centrosome microtubule-binding domain-containing protein n=1 Tax=Terfezia boudieri ATCC MYA-4762 TaxID=1051890 RepID=A0A3N4LFF0_9PEZI|nr:hypothetical protein L211DRAFT_869862 [Terfezia boudieri ATCC MYA-4762]
MAYDFEGDTTGFTNEHFTSFPPQTSFERDRLRLQRELDRDLDHPSFSSTSVSGLENAGRPFIDDDTNTFDIENDARATSTRKVNFNAGMLQSSPQINSRILAAEFADFSMANDFTEESVEIGRAREKNLSSQDYARAPFSTRGASARTTASKRLSEAYATAGREMASPIPKQSRQNSIRSDTSEVVLPLNKNVVSMPTNKNKDHQKNRLMEEDTFDLSKPVPKKSARQISVSSTGSKPRKTTEQVTSGAARSSVASRVNRVEDGASSVASLDDIIPQKTRKMSKSVGVSTLGGTRGPSLRTAMRAAEAKDATNFRRKSSTAPAAASTAAGGEVPRTFKSTAAFIKELGLDGHSLNALQDPPTYDETVDLTNQNNTNEQSFLLPNLAGISELINTEATRIYNNTASARKRNPHGQPPSHKPLESIPVPQDNRAILMAMQLLQDKMAALEEQNSVTEKRCEDLKEQLRRVRHKYEKEYQRARVAEDELVRTKKSGPATAVGSANADTEALRENAEDKERSKIAFMVEKMKLENTITSYKTQIDEISHRFEITKIALKNMQDERNSAVNSAAAAIASQRHLQEENEKFRDQLDAMRVEKVEYEQKVNFEREAWKAKEQILRKRADKAREAEGIAREAINGLQKRLNEIEKRNDTQDSEVAELVKRELERLKPELLAQSGAAPESLSKRRSIATTWTTTHSAPATVTIAAPAHRETITNNISMPSVKKTTQQIPDEEGTKGASSPDDANETAYTVDGNYIRRIADEIDQERRRRKEAEKRAAATSAEMERIREIVGNKTTSSVKKKTGASVTSKRYPESAVSGREQTITINTQRLLPRPLSAPPTSVIYISEAETAHKVSGGHSGNSNPNKRRIKKVVYYEEGDTSQVSTSKDRAANIEQRRSAAPAGMAARAPAQSSSVKTGPQDFDAFLNTARKHNSTSNNKHTYEFDFDKQEGTLPPPPVIPDHIKSVIDVEAEHDPLSCTVCVRREMQSLQEESRIMARTHGVEPAAGQEHIEGYQELSTLRPSKPAGKQLSNVVRGLQDEFVHLKMAYQERAEEFLSLDPTKGKRRRKEITREINDMVAEMDWKCDMIYALYDVAEEFVSTRPHQVNGTKSSSSAPKGKVTAHSINSMGGVDSGAEHVFEYTIPKRNGKLVEVEDADDSDEYRGHMGNMFGVNMGRGGDNEVSLLDETSEVEENMNMQIARHLKRQGKEVDRQSGRKQERVVKDSYDEGEETFRI